MERLSSHQALTVKLSVLIHDDVEHAHLLLVNWCSNAGRSPPGCAGASLSGRVVNGTGTPLRANWHTAPNRGQ
jgi:hypothetical protein